MKRIIELGFCLLLSFSLSPIQSRASTIEQRVIKTRRSSAANNDAERIILDWTALGSGCKSSRSKPSKDVRLTGHFSKSLTARLEIQSLELRLDKKDRGVSECAIRMSVQPPKDHRIVSVVAQAPLLAHKDDQTHLRARLLLLLGETLVANQDWDLQATDFAKNRQENILLASGSKAEYQMPVLRCGQPQIVGLDYTFEGVIEKTRNNVEKNSEPSWLKTGVDAEKNSARIEVFFQKCSP